MLNTQVNTDLHVYVDKNPGILINCTYIHKHTCGHTHTLTVQYIRYMYSIYMYTYICTHYFCTKFYVQCKALSYSSLSSMKRTSSQPTKVKRADVHIRHTLVRMYVHVHAHVCT